MTGRSTPPNNTPPVSAASASNTETTTNTTTTPLSIAAVTSQTQTTPQTSSGAITVTTSALPSTVVTSMVGVPSSSSSASPVCNYRITPNMSLFHTDRIRPLDGTNRCGESSLLFLCHLFGIPESQIPLPVRVPTDEYAYLDLMSPLNAGTAEGAFSADGLNDVMAAQIQCTGNATQNYLNQLDKTRPYLLTTSAVSGGHTVTLFFDHTTNCWAVYNSQSRIPVVNITDPQGILNGRGGQLLPPNAPQHTVDISPMSPQRVHFLMRYIYRLRTTHRMSVPTSIPGRVTYTETFPDFETRVLRQYRDEIINTAVDYTFGGGVNLPADFNPATMLSRALPDRPGVTTLPESFFSFPHYSGARQEGTTPQIVPTAPQPPQPSSYPSPAGYEEYFAWAQLDLPVNQGGDQFSLEASLSAAGIISGDLNNCLDGDFVISMPEQTGNYEHLLGVLDREAVYMLPFYRTRGQGDYQGTWRSVVLLQFVNNEWTVFSAVHGPNVLSTDGGDTIPAANARTHFNPQRRLPLDSSGVPYFPIFRMTPERFARIVQLNRRLQGSRDLNTAMAAELNISESPENVAPPAEPLPQRVPPPQPQQGQNMFNFPATNRQEISHRRPEHLEGTPYPQVNSNRYVHLPGASCVDQSVDFLSQYFGLPVPQWPAPQDVRNRNALDIAGPLILGPEHGVVRPWPLGRSNIATDEADAVRLFDLFDQDLDKETPYLVYTESPSYGHHIVALYFDYAENEWFTFNCNAPGCNGQPVRVTDCGNFTNEGESLFAVNTDPQIRARARQLHFFAMDNERTEYMCEYVRRERLRDPLARVDLAAELTDYFPHRYMGPAAQAIPNPLPSTRIPSWTTQYDFSSMAPVAVQIQPPAVNMQPIPMVQEGRYAHLAGIGCAEQSLDFAARCFGLPIPAWTEPDARIHAQPLDLFGPLGCAVARGIVSPESYNLVSTRITNDEQASDLFFAPEGEDPLLNENRMYLMGVQGSAYNSHLVIVYFDQVLGRWFSYNNVALESSEVIAGQMFVKPVPLTNAEGSLTPEGRRLLLPVRQYQAPRVPGAEPQAPYTRMAAVELSDESVEFLCNWVLRVRAHGLPIDEVAAVSQAFVRRYQPPGNNQGN